MDLYLSAAVSHHCSNSPDYCPVISCDLPYHEILQPDYYTIPHITHLLAGVEAICCGGCRAVLGGCCQRWEKIVFKNSTDGEAECNFGSILSAYQLPSPEKQ